MRMQLPGKSLSLVIVVSAICGAAAALGVGTQAFSKGQAASSVTEIAKTSTAKAAQPVARERMVASEDASAVQDSWKRWPTLTDF